MNFSLDSLRTILEVHTPQRATGWVIAVSGGADSACLLAAAAQLGEGFLQLPLRAVHVDHGLQSAAADLRQACVALCARWHIPLAIISVVVAIPAGVSIEAAARDARYAALAEDLKLGECLLTAHHREDQAESVLLQALRGAGPKGLSAMPSLRPLGSGWHLRPLLNVSQRDLHEYCASLNLPYASDPMNEDLRFDRVYLRRQLWPLIAKRWPGAGAALSRSALHASDAQAFLERAARVDIATLRDGDRLVVSRLRALRPSQQINVLRHWISSAGVLLPSRARLSEALRQILQAKSDHLPAIIWDCYALRRYRDRVFLTRAASLRLTFAVDWLAPQSTLDLGNGLGKLRMIAQTGGLAADKLPLALSVRGRGGGERIRPHRRASTQSVQHLCQARGVLPWMRDALPLVYAGDTLVAVGDLWLDARWCVPNGTLGLGILWEDAPVLI